MNSGCIRIGVNGNWRDSQVATSANYAHRDLASISNQDFAKHGKEGGRPPTDDLWSAVTSHRFGLRRHVAVVLRSPLCA
jgi:hypothetical protein